MPGCRSYEDLLSAAPSDISQADKVAKKQAKEEAAQQLERARQKVNTLSSQTFLKFCQELILECLLLAS